MKKNIIICSGGTGGHILPAISMSNYLKDENNIILITDKRSLKYMLSIDFEKHIFNLSSFSTKNPFKKIISIIKLFVAFMYSIFFILKKNIDIVFGLGGYVSFPVLLAARLLNKRIFLYEPNLVLGRTNKFFINSCNKIFTNSNDIINIPNNNKSKFIEVGTILRDEIVNFPEEIKQKKYEEKTIIILGGSQGAKIFGEIIPSAILELHKNNFKVKIIQQTTLQQVDSVRNFYNKNNIKCNVFNFDPNIARLISKSDLAISRSGASTVAELEFLQVPFINIPYPYAMDNHQLQNALHYKAKKISWMIEQDNFTKINLSNLLLQIFNNINDLEDKRKKMASYKKNNTLKLIKKGMSI